MIQQKVDGLSLVRTKEATVWVDASSLALGIVIEVDGHVVEYAAGCDPKMPPLISIWLNLTQ